MKRFILIPGFALAAAGAALTIIEIATRTSEPSPISFDLGMALITPAVAVGRALRIREGAHAWLWDSLEVLLNTGLCFFAGALVGLAIYLAVSGLSKRKELSG